MGQKSEEAHAKGPRPPEARAAAEATAKKKKAVVMASMRHLQDGIRLRSKKTAHDEAVCG
jgi:hypothetical protein